MTNDLILVKNIQENIDSEFSLNKLHDLHSGIYYKMVNSYISDKDINLKEELYKESKYHVFFAAKEFDFSRKIKFSTYLGNKTRWMCLNLNFKNKKTLNFLDMFDKSEEMLEDTGLSLIESLTKKEFIEKIFSVVNKQKDERLKKIFHLRYIEGNKNKVMPWKFIGKELNLSIQGCINIHNNFIKKIQKSNYGK
jgi:hypothetical protein